MGRQVVYMTSLEDFQRSLFLTLFLFLTLVLALTLTRAQTEALFLTVCGGTLKLGLRPMAQMLVLTQTMTLMAGRCSSLRLASRFKSAVM